MSEDCAKRGARLMMRARGEWMRQRIVRLPVVTMLAYFRLLPYVIY